MRIAAVLLACAWLLPAQAQDPAREAEAARIIEATSIDRLILANARAKAAADPRSEQHVTQMMYRLRPPAIWSAKHPAWAPARNALGEMVGRESNQWIETFWRENGMKNHVRELAYALRLPDLVTIREFTESPGGRAWFARRLAEARMKSGEAMFSLDPATAPALEKLAADARRRFDALPASEKQRVTAFVNDPGCNQCNQSLSKILEMIIAHQSDWIADVLVSHLGGIPYQAQDTWRAELDAKFGTQLPVDSKKQLLGTLEMRGDAALIFRFTFQWNDAADGGRLALDIPKSHPNYAEALALAPGLGPGQSRVLYHDENGIVSDRP